MSRDKGWFKTEVKTHVRESLCVDKQRFVCKKRAKSKIYRVSEISVSYAEAQSICKLAKIDDIHEYREV